MLCQFKIDVNMNKIHVSFSSVYKIFSLYFGYCHKPVINHVYPNLDSQIERLIPLYGGIHMIKTFNKKMIAAIVAGTFLFVGAIAPFAVKAATADKNERPRFHQRQIDPQQAAARLSEAFGISQATVLKYHNDGYPFHDLGKAAFLAKASGKTFEDVLALKTGEKTWRTVAEELGVSREQMRATRQDLQAERISSKLNISKATVTDLQSKGYRGHDIAMAGILSKKTGKSAQNILNMKQINNTWFAVAESLEVDKEAFAAEMKEFRGSVPFNKGRCR
jgi:plasmid maintenance system antidote protein VapI